ncbi:MAG: hypothetical protein AAF550_03225, partial [Myxococcota bacterium]
MLHDSSGAAETALRLLSRTLFGDAFGAHSSSVRPSPQLLRLIEMLVECRRCGVAVSADAGAEEV